MRLSVVSRDANPALPGSRCNTSHCAEQLRHGIDGRGHQGRWEGCNRRSTPRHPLSAQNRAPLFVDLARSRPHRRRGHSADHCPAGDQRNSEGGLVTDDLCVEQTWRGNFWLPDKPDHAQQGFLNYSPHDGVTLSLVGGFNDRRADTDITNRVHAIRKARVAFPSSTARSAVACPSRWSIAG